MQEREVEALPSPLLRDFPEKCFEEMYFQDETCYGIQKFLREKERMLLSKSERVCFCQRRISGRIRSDVVVDEDDQLWYLFPLVLSPAHFESFFSLRFYRT
jgi:hypothetical protein